MPYFSKNITYLREKLRLKQSDVAAGVNIKPSRYGNYETGHSKPDYDTLVKISKYFGVGIELLVFYDLSFTHTTQDVFELSKRMLQTTVKEFVRRYLPEGGSNNGNNHFEQSATDLILNRLDEIDARLKRLEDKNSK